MSKRYKIREEVSVGGKSRFYVMSKYGWGYETTWSDCASEVKIVKHSLKDAQAEVEHLKKSDAEQLKYKQDSKIVKVKYHD